MSAVSVEQLVREHIRLPAHPNSRGWYPVLCKVCNDHGRKGPRAAFLFENGGVAYHCFNCQAKATYSPSDHNTLTKSIEKILIDFGIPQEDINRVKLDLLGKKYDKKEATKRATSYEPQKIELPSHFKLLNYDSVWCEVAKEYLLERCIDPDSYPFMISTGVCEDLDKHPKQVQLAKIKEAEKWVGRVIIPIFKEDNLIFYTGRDMTGNKVKKYESPSTPKHNVIYGFDELFKDTEQPLYIVEGIFDAMVIDGVSLLGAEMSDNQIYWLNRSHRQKVYIPDKFGDGDANAYRAIDQGWSVACPEVGDCKDINEAVQKYGKLYVLTTINQTTKAGFAARTQVGIYCK